jgi:kynurenine formamidase
VGSATIRPGPLARPRIATLKAIAVDPTYEKLSERTDAPPGSSWGVFGDSDDYGTLNFLTPDRVRAAAECVKRGAVFSLDFPLDAFPGPFRWRSAPQHTIFNVGSRADGTSGPVSEPSMYLDDEIDGLYLQSTSHVDALRHCAHPDHGFYDGVPRSDMVPGNPRLGIGRWAERGIVGRGVLADIARLRQAQGRPLNHVESETFGPALIEETLAEQGTELRPGDMLLLHTDCIRHLERFAQDDAAAHHNAGIEPTRRMVSWLWDHQISLIASDNVAVESSQGSARSEFGEGRAGRLHAQLIALLGMAIGELWNLRPLAEDCAATSMYEFLLVVKPLHLAGGVGSPANATAIK